MLGVGWCLLKIPKAIIFLSAAQGLPSKHMTELSSFQGNILVTDPTRRDEDTPLCGESGTM